MLKKRIMFAAAAMATIIGLGACAQTSKQIPQGQALENQQQAQGTQSIVNNQPLPHFNTSQLRQNLIEIESAQSNGVQTTSFFYNQGVKEPISSCPSIGFPIPNTMSLSNPQQIVNSYTNGNIATGVISQMDHNGVYSPTSSSGTYVICVDDTGKPYAHYWEGFVDTISGTATIDASGKIKLLGAPTGGFSAIKK